MKRIASLLILVLAGQTVAKPDAYTYTTIGKVTMTVSNFGMYGNGFQLYDPNTLLPLPSCEYPAGSGTERLFRAAVWVGGITTAGDTLVTTGASDVWQASAGSEGFEFAPTAADSDTVIERSSLITSQYYDPEAISEQDFLSTYTDYLEYVPNHDPLELRVEQKILGWSYSYMDDIVIIDLTVHNDREEGDIRDVYLGVYGELMSANRTFWGDEFGRTPSYLHKRVFFEDSLRMMYERNDGFDTLAVGYGAFKVLGVESSVMPIDSMNVNFQWWAWQDVGGSTGDNVRYEFMSNPEDAPDVDDGYVAAYGFPKPILLMSLGPIPYIAQGDSLRFIFAFVGGMDYEGLLLNSSWAQRAYDYDYILPAPPPSPPLSVVPSNQRVDLYWEKTPEGAVDPNTGKEDFEGYKIYRRLEADTSWTLLAQFDLRPEDDTLLDHSMGFNTGLPETLDTGEYAGHRHFADDGVSNGFTYVYAITSYDVGDESAGLESLESATSQNATEVIPGTSPTSEEGAEVGVYPNPYRGYSLWDGSGPRDRVLRFYNLPENCVIYVFNLAGDLVKTIEHDDPHSGEEAWNLITDRDQAIASGLYVYAVEDKSNGHVKRGKFLVIR
jgi:hypothetical protein